MRVFKSSAFIWIAVILVVGYAYIYEYKGKKEQEKLELEQKKILQMDPNDITSFKLKNPKGTVSLKKENNKWQVLDPYQDEADTTTVESFLTALADEVSEDTIAQGAEVDSAVYGLQDSSFVEVVSPSQTIQVNLGTVNALAGKKYLKVGDKVILGSSTWETHFNKDFNEFRKKDMVDILYKQITKIEFLGKNKLTLEKQDSKWEVLDFKTGDLDAKEVESFIGSIVNLRASQFDLSKTASGKELFEIRIYGDSADPVKLNFSNLDGSLTKVVSNKRDIAFKISAVVAASLNKSLDDFRDRARPVKMDRNQVSKIYYNSDLVTLKIKKQGNSWVWDGEGSKEIDSAQVERLLNKLSNLKVKSFLGKDIPFQKSGMIELELLSETSSLLKLVWSPRIINDLFVTKSSLSDEYIGLTTADVQGLPVQTIIKDPKESEKLKEVTD